MILKLVGMVLLGILGAALSYYKKNYYVSVFNDILGKEEDEKASTRVGRGFLYGFLFPVYFVLLLAGLAALVVFLISAGIIAAIVFIIVWITEKILPHDWFGDVLIGLFQKLGLKGAPEPVVPEAVPADAVTTPAASAAPPPSEDKPAGQG